MTVAARRGLFDEGEMDRVLTSGGGVGGGIAGGNHQGDFVNPGGQHFFDDDFQGRFLGAVVIDQRLQRQRPLSPRPAAVMIALRMSIGGSLHRCLRLSVCRTAARSTSGIPRCAHGDPVALS